MKVKIQAFVHWQKYSWEDKADYCVYSCNMEGHGTERIFISEQTVEIEIPDSFDPRPGLVKILRDEKSKILAEAHVKAENLEEQIQQLLALEDKS